MELGEFSQAVRESSLKRFRAVPAECADWRCRPDAFSIAALASHLVAADRWLFEKLADSQLLSMIGALGSPCSYSQPLIELETTGRERAMLD